MPILAFAVLPQESASLDGSQHRSTYVQVSNAACATLSLLLNDNESRLGNEALSTLRRLRTMREFDADLDLVITAIERYGSVDAVFL